VTNCNIDHIDCRLKHYNLGFEFSIYYSILFNGF